MDYKINIFKNQTHLECQSEWFNRGGITCLGLILYTRKWEKEVINGKVKWNEKLMKEEHAFLSEDTKHDAYFTISSLTIFVLI